MDYKNVTKNNSNMCTYATTGHNNYYTNYIIKIYIGSPYVSILIVNVEVYAVIYLGCGPSPVKYL